jgi:hypothetical protein
MDHHFSVSLPISAFRSDREPKPKIVLLPPPKKKNHDKISMIPTTIVVIGTM